MSDEGVNRLQENLYDEIQKKRKQIVRSIDRKEHAKIVRKELKEQFPDIKFSVITDIFSGGDSVTVQHVGIDITKEKHQEITKFVNQFSGFESDLMDGRYNVGFIYKDERIQGASFCSYNGKKWCN